MKPLALLTFLTLLLTGCGKPPNLKAMRAALDEVRICTSDLQVKRAKTEHTLATATDAENYKAAKAALEKAEKAARDAGAGDADLRLSQEAGEREGKKLILEFSK